MRGLTSIRELDRIELDRLLDRARELSADPRAGRRTGAVVGLLFYSGSLRTRVGFEAAAARLGAAAPVVLSARHTEVMSEPESLADALRSVGPWCDAICLRHPDEESVRAAVSLAGTPIVNCGNGTDEHPTQALIDLFAVRSQLGRIDGLRFAMVGDLRGMRAAHSLALALSRCRGIHLRLIAPRGLEMPRAYLAPLAAAGVVIEETERLELADADVVYVAGLPARTAIGRLPDPVRARFVVSRAVALGLKEGARILCPLPRIDEIAQAVDALPQAAYFAQSAQAIGVRMAVLERALGGGAAADQE